MHKHARRKEDGGRAMDGARPAASNLMERAPREPTLRQAGVDLRDTERHGGGAHMTAVPKLGDPGAQLVQNAFLPRMQHGSSGRLQNLFILCSIFSGGVNEGGSQSSAKRGKRGFYSSLARITFQVESCKARNRELSSGRDQDTSNA